MVGRIPNEAVTLTALKGIPLVGEGDDLGAMILAALRDGGMSLEDGDVVVVAQKIVSKSEGRTVFLDEVSVGPEAAELAATVDKDPRLVELILSESDSVIKTWRGVIITGHKLGHVMANAGIDASNVDQSERQSCLLLPVDPDASAAALKRALEAETGKSCGVIISDSFGRPWRNGITGVAIGVAGVPSVIDRRGATDLFGNELRVTEIALADEMASAASLLMGQSDEGAPVVLLRGYRTDAPNRPAADLIRAREKDMFR